MVAGFKNHQAKRQCSQDFVVLDFANHKCLRACLCGSGITLAVSTGRHGNAAQGSGGIAIHARMCMQELIDVRQQFACRDGAGQTTQA